MLSKQVGRALGFRSLDARAGCCEPCLGQFKLAVHAFASAVGDNALGGTGGVFLLVEHTDRSRNLIQLAIGEGGIEDDLVSAVLAEDGGGGPFPLGGADEFTLGSIEQ